MSGEGPDRLEGFDLPPSWGEVGALLRQLHPEVYEQILRHHLDMIALERQRLPPPPRPLEKVDTRKRRGIEYRAPKPEPSPEPTDVHVV